MLNSCGESIEKLSYALNILNVYNMLQKNKVLYNKSTDSLQEQTAITLLMIAHYIGIKSSHHVNQTDQLIQMIMKSINPSKCIYTHI